MSLENKQILKMANVMTLDLYHELIKDMPYGVMVCNTNGDFILWNQVAENLFKSELKGSNREAWADEFGVFKLDRVTKYKTEDIPMSRALKGETVTGEKLFITNNGMPDGIFIEVNAYPIKDEYGDQVIAGVVIFEDISKEQKFYETIVGKIGELETYLKTVLKFEKYHLAM